MREETWTIREQDKVITAAMLSGDPDKHGGLGMHMMCAILDKVVTIPIREQCDGYLGCCCSIQTSDAEAVKRILKDGGVTILSDKYWTDIRTVRVCFLGTAEPVPVWRGGVV